MKTVLFLPGFKETLKDRDYKKVIDSISSKGYKVKFVPIKWDRTTLVDWAKQLDFEYKKHDPNDTILAGFSFGSLTAFMSAVKLNPAELWLYSFSPYFSDDMPKMKKAWLKNIGHRRADVFRGLDFNVLAESIKCKTIIIMGEVEAKKYPLLEKRSERANKMIKNSKLIIVPRADHDVTDQSYIKAIENSI